MKNKRLAICLSIFAFLVILIVLSSTIFALNQVSLSFLSPTDRLNGKGEDIVKSVDFKFGQNVLFANKKGYISQLEKNNPYLKVINIETIFPNKFVINAVERQELFAIKLANNSYAIVDGDFKVLEIVENYINSASNAIVLTNIKDLPTSVEIADFLQFDKKQMNVLSSTINSLYEWQENSVLKQKIESVEVDYERLNQVSVKMRSGVQIVVKDANEYNSDKFNLAFSAYESNAKYQNSGILEVRLVNGNELRIFYSGE